MKQAQEVDQSSPHIIAHVSIVITGRGKSSAFQESENLIEKSSKSNLKPSLTLLESRLRT